MTIKKEKIKKHLDSLTERHYLNNDGKTEKGQRRKPGVVPKTAKLTFYLEEEVNEMLRVYAVWQKKKISDAINEILKEYLKNTKVPDMLDFLKKDYKI